MLVSFGEHCFPVEEADSDNSLSLAAVISVPRSQWGCSATAREFIASETKVGVYTGPKNDGMGVSMCLPMLSSEALEVAIHRKGLRGLGWRSTSWKAKLRRAHEANFSRRIAEQSGPTADFSKVVKQAQHVAWS